LLDTVPLDEERLNDHSRSFAQALFSARPYWREFARMAKPRHGSGMFLFVTVIPPESSKAEHPLIIDTDDDEVTIGFDSYHAHFHWPDFDEEYGNPLRFIDDVVGERLVVVSIWSGEDWALSTTLDAAKSVDEISRIPQSATIAKLRSWTGRYSRDESLPLRSDRIGG